MSGQVTIGMLEYWNNGVMARIPLFHHSTIPARRQIKRPLKITFLQIVVEI